MSVFYPNSAGAKFDIDYYCNRHIPLVSEIVGDALRSVSVEKGLAGEFNADVPHLTNVLPTVQISEVRM